MASVAGWSWPDLAAAVAALPAQRPGLAVLVLPALAPRGGRPAAQQGPATRRGSRSAHAPQLLEMMVPVLRRLAGSWPGLPALQLVVLLCCDDAGHVGAMRAVASSCLDREA
jgi:hypothetical protein